MVSGGFASTLSDSSSRAVTPALLRSSSLPSSSSGWSGREVWRYRDHPSGHEPGSGGPPGLIEMYIC